MANAESVTRQSIRTPRAAAVAGIAFSVLLTIAFVLVRVAVPDASDEPGTWVIDDTKRNTVVAALNLLPFAGIAFLWFIGVVRDRIGHEEDRFFATVFLGSGLLFVAMLFVTGAVAGGLVVSSEESPTADVWSYGRHVTYTLLTGYATRMAAVFAISTTTIVTRLGLLPRWLTILGFAGGIVLLLSAGWIPWIELIFPAWVFLFSSHILFLTFRAKSEGPETLAG